MDNWSESDLVWASYAGLELQRQLDWMNQDSVAFDLLAWHDGRFAAASWAACFADLAATAPARYAFETCADSVVLMIESFSPRLRPLGILKKYQTSLFFQHAFCPVMPDCVHFCILCQRFWYRRLQGFWYRRLI
ncbi:unnamed protein product [Calypogeia fissa]